MPIGPTNLWIVRAALPPVRKIRNVFAFVIGLVFFDAFYAVLAYWGYSAWLTKSTYLDGTMFFGGCGLVLLGFYDLCCWFRVKFQVSAILSKEESEESLALDLLKGFLLGSNPTFIAYWFVVVGTGVSYLSRALTPINMLSVFLGIVVADLLWYAFLFCFAKRFAYAASERLIGLFSLIVAVAFLSSGSILVYKAFG